MRGSLIVLSSIATLSVFYYVSRVDSLLSLKSNLRSVSNEIPLSSSKDVFFDEVQVNSQVMEEPQRRLVVVHDAEGLRASLLPDRLEQASSWDILLECRNPIFVSTPLIIPSFTNIRISSPYWTNSPSIIARDATRIFSMETDSTLELSNIQLSSGVADEGGAVFNDGGKLSLSGCMLLNHTAHDRGGAIFSKNGEVKLENTTFSGCAAGDAGGGIFVSSGTDIRKKDKHHIHGRKLVSFSRVGFDNNRAPFGADFILGEHEVFKSSHFFYQLLSSSWFHLTLAALFGALFAFSISFISLHLKWKCFKNSFINHSNKLFFSQSLTTSSPSSLLNGLPQSVPYDNHTSLSSFPHFNSNNVITIDDGDDDYDIEMLSSRKNVEFLVKSAQSNFQLIHDNSLNNIHQREIKEEEKEEEKYKINEKSENVVVSNILQSFDWFIQLKDLFQMTLVARGAHSSVYRAVVKTNGRFGTLPPLMDQDSSSSLNEDVVEERKKVLVERVVAVKRLTYDFKKVKNFNHPPKNKTHHHHHKEEEEDKLNEDELEYIRQWQDECTIMSSLTPHANVLGLVAIIADHDKISLSRHDQNSPFGLGMALEWMPGSLRDALDAGLLPPRPPTMLRGYEEEEIEYDQSFSRNFPHGKQPPLQSLSSSSSSQHDTPLTVLSSRIALDVTKGLLHLHSNNVVHRDLKATNIMLDQFGRAKLSDFGISVFQETKPCLNHDDQLLTNMKKSQQINHHDCQNMKMIKRPIGTLLYAAPELLKQEGLWNKKSSVDMWALGMVMIEIYAGKPLLHLWRQTSEKESFYSDHQTVSMSHQALLGATSSSSSSISTSSPFQHGFGSAGRLPTMLQACGWRPDLRELNLARESLGGLLNQSWSYSPQERPNANEFLFQLERITQTNQRIKSSLSPLSSINGTDISSSSSSSSSSCNSSTNSSRRSSSSSSLSGVSTGSFFKQKNDNVNNLEEKEDIEYAVEESLTTGSFSPTSSLSSEHEEEEEDNKTSYSTSLVITSQPGNVEDPPYANASALCPNGHQELEHQIMIQVEDDELPHLSNENQTTSLLPRSSSQFQDAWGGWFSSRTSQGAFSSLTLSGNNVRTQISLDKEETAQLEPLSMD